MPTITDDLLKFLGGMNPDERQEFLGQLSRQAREARQEREQAAEFEAKLLQQESAGELRAKLEKLRSKPGQTDRAEYDRVYSAYLAAAEREQAASRPAPAPAKQYSGRSVREIRADLDELRSQPTYKMDTGKYSRLVTELESATKAGAYEPVGGGGEE